MIVGEIEQKTNLRSKVLMTLEFILMLSDLITLVKKLF